MKAEIQSQIKNIDKQIEFPEFSNYTIQFLHRRRNFLEHILNADVNEVDDTAVKFVYGEEK